MIILMSKFPLQPTVQRQLYLNHHICSNSACLGPIPVSASAAMVEAALNSLWSIKPDTVRVTKQDDSQGSHYTVTFSSDRGIKGCVHLLLLLQQGSLF